MFKSLFCVSAMLEYSELAIVDYLCCDDDILLWMLLTYCFYAYLLASGFGMILSLSALFWICLFWMGVFFLCFCFLSGFMVTVACGWKGVLNLSWRLEFYQSVLSLLKQWVSGPLIYGIWWLGRHRAVDMVGKHWEWVRQAGAETELLAFYESWSFLIKVRKDFDL